MRADGGKIVPAQDELMSGSQFYRHVSAESAEDDDDEQEAQEEEDDRGEPWSIMGNSEGHQGVLATELTLTALFFFYCRSLRGGFIMEAEMRKKRLT